MRVAKSLPPPLIQYDDAKLEMVGCERYAFFLSTAERFVFGAAIHQQHNEDKAMVERKS